VLVSATLNQRSLSEAEMGVRKEREKYGIKDYEKSL